MRKITLDMMNNAPEYKDKDIWDIPYHSTSDEEDEDTSEESSEESYDDEDEDDNEEKSKKPLKD